MDHEAHDALLIWLQCACVRVCGFLRWFDACISSSCCETSRRIRPSCRRSDKFFISSTFRPVFLRYAGIAEKKKPTSALHHHPVSYNQMCRCTVRPAFFIFNAYKPWKHASFLIFFFFCCNTRSHSHLHTHTHKPCCPHDSVPDAT